ncbi:hypothetical protein [Paucibacter sp. Y2R2-4]|uniref:hypothetical protein n=1 Tax=Paucibacter sp. Y2R2-4 TaxID=2893553 RepID=UPI0021E460C7|nr:hypothetical protein [Paucibacter sp. Y2R2-4]MCV2350649.1 hypothetical protein [Paucibacter sp. Y2R2-4]
MTLGSSFAIDFAVCTGLGVAATSCFLANLVVLRELKFDAAQKVRLAILRVVLFVIFVGGMLSVAVVIGDTKSVRDSDSIWGFVFGAILLVPTIRLVLKTDAQA